MTEGPYKLPEGWRWVRLGEVFEVQQGASMSPQRRLGRNPKPFLRTRNILWGTVDTLLVDEMDFTDEEAEKLSLQPGDLLVCEGGDVGRTAIWEGQLPTALFQNHIHRLRAKDAPIEPRFIMYWMQAAYQVFLAYQGEESRTAIPNLSGRRLKAFLAPLPPREEQRRIVARIEELMAQVREARRLRQQAKEDAERLWQSTLAETFPRPGAEPPPGWRWVRLGEVVNASFSGGTPSTKVQAYWDGDIPWTTSAPIGEDDISLKTYMRTITQEGLESSASKIAPSGSLILATRVGVGKAVVATFDVAISQDLTALILCKDVNPVFLAYLFKSGNMQAQLETRTRGTTIKGIPRKELLTAPIPLPPLNEQRRIVAHLEALQEKVKVLKEIQTTTEAELQRLEQAVLDKTFRGEL